MVSKQQNRIMFIDSIVRYVEENKFDGVDLVWLDPATRGGLPQDKQNYVLFFKDLRKAFDPKGWYIGVSVNPRKEILDVGYDLSSIAKEVDLMHVLAYNYHGSWDGVTGHVSPLNAGDNEFGEQRQYNVNFTLNYILSQGVPSSKLVLGVPFFGRSFILKNPAVNGVGAPATTGFKGHYIGELEIMGYNEICKLLTKPTSNWAVHYTDSQLTNYMVDGEKWVSFDDVFSMKQKVSNQLHYITVGNL